MFDTVPLRTMHKYKVHFLVFLNNMSWFQCCHIMWDIVSFTACFTRYYKIARSTYKPCYMVVILCGFVAHYMFIFVLQALTSYQTSVGQALPTSCFLIPYKTLCWDDVQKSMKWGFQKCNEDNPPNGAYFLSKQLCHTLLILGRILEMKAHFLSWYFVWIPSVCNLIIITKLS